MLETAAHADIDAASALMARCRLLGVHFALDDFGTGYSSLAYLCNFRFDKIKIDRSFVQSMADTDTSRTIVQSVVMLGRGLGMGIVAEGVETEYEAVMMTHFGCTELQGYFFARPMDAESLSAVLESYEPKRYAAVPPPVLVKPAQGATG